MTTHATTTTSHRAYTLDEQQRGLRRLYLAVGAVMGLMLGPAAYSVLEMGALPTCF